MAPVTSNSTGCPSKTAPGEASAGPSIAGRVLNVTVPSFHAQLLIRWMLPPETLCEFVTVETCMRRLAAVTTRAPTPLTRTRSSVCLTGLPSTSSTLLRPLFFAGKEASTNVSASTVATGAGHVQSGRHAPGQSALSAPSHCSVARFT